MMVEVDKDEEQKQGNTNIIGLILLLLSQFFAGSMFIIEEKLLGSYYIHPLKVVGWEGIWGCVIFLILLPIF